MKYELKNIATIRQVADLAACSKESVGNNARTGNLDCVYPFPYKGGQGPIMILCNKKLEYFLIKMSTSAARNLKKKSYDPFEEAKKRFEFL